MVRSGANLLISFAIPGDLDAPTGGYAYARRVLEEWKKSGVAAEVIQLPGGFPAPSDADLLATEKALLAAEPPLLIDGLAYGAFPVELARKIGPRATVLVHHPLAEEDGNATLVAPEREALSFANNVLATSPHTARSLRDTYAVPRCIVALPGTPRAPQAPLAGSPPRILCVGSITRRKGHDLLVEALKSVKDLPWRCDLVGAKRNEEWYQAVDVVVKSSGLQERISLPGEVPEAPYAGADIYVQPSRHEGYGMAVVEAMAHGLPVICSDAGALPGTAPCALHHESGDPVALAAALKMLLQEPQRRQEVGARCRTFSQTLPDWSETASLIAEAVQQ